MKALIPFAGGPGTALSSLITLPLHSLVYEMLLLLCHQLGAPTQVMIITFPEPPQIRGEIWLCLYQEKCQIQV